MCAARRDGFVSVNGVPTHVVCWGAWVEGGLHNHKQVVLMIPGNPGLTGYYTEFLETIYTRLNIPVWTISHAGHEIPSTPEGVPSLSSNPHLYDLSGQIQHKIAFIQTYIPKDVKIYLIGHSIGCKIILQALKNSRINSQVLKCYLLFPAIERMAETFNGKFLTYLVLPLVPVICFLAGLFTLFPNTVQNWLIYLYFSLQKIPITATETTKQLIRPGVLRNVFYFAKDELNKVLKLDKEIIDHYSNILHLYYGSSDGWCPVKYYEEMQEYYPKVKSVLCQSNFSHAFVLRSSSEVGSMVSEWIMQDMKQ